MTNLEFKSFFRQEKCLNAAACVGAFNYALEQLRVLDLQLHHPEQGGKRTYPIESTYGIPHHSASLAKIKAEKRYFDISRITWASESLRVVDEDGVTSLSVGMGIGKWVWDNDAQTDQLSAVFEAKCSHTTDAWRLVGYQMLAELILDPESSEMVVRRDAEIHMGPKRMRSMLGSGKGGKVLRVGPWNGKDDLGDHDADND
jgi:hypothetical protein